MLYHVRSYENDDHDAVMTVWENASPQAHPFLNEPFLDLERVNISNICLPILNTWIVEEGRHIVGFMTMVGNEVKLLFVLPEYQHSGAGRALMDKARELFDELEVEVFKENAHGCSFYKMCGFLLMYETTHQPTGHELLHLKYSVSHSSGMMY